MSLKTAALSLGLVGTLLAYPVDAQTPTEETQEMKAADLAKELPQQEEVEAAESTQPVVLMDARWAELACDAWNENPTLTDGLAAPGWVANNQDRGYKVIQIYRTDCETSPWVELHIADQNGEARCNYGGPVKTTELLGGVDYIMHAQTQRWQEMGAGNYGPMKGMMTGRLKFKGPKWEAMKNMGPFTSFLQLAGEVPSDASICPTEATS